MTFLDEELLGFMIDSMTLDELNELEAKLDALEAELDAMVERANQ